MKDCRDAFLGTCLMIKNIVFLLECLFWRCIWTDYMSSLLLSFLFMSNSWPNLLILPSYFVLIIIGMWLLQFQGPGIVNAGLPGHSNVAEPLLILSLIPVLSLIWQVKMPAVAENLFLLLVLNAVWIQPGEMGFIRAAATPSGPVLPPPLADVQQHSGESQGQTQEQRHVVPELSAPQSQPELRRRPLAAPSHCQITHIWLWGWRRLLWG